jgi:hypothetical protein
MVPIRLRWMCHEPFTWRWESPLHFSLGIVLMVVVVLPGLRFPVREEIFTCSVCLSGSLSCLGKASDSKNQAWMACE